jgi:ABC-type Fe3+ transport system substrate-binding protein
MNRTVVALVSIAAMALAGCGSPSGASGPASPSGPAGPPAAPRAIPAPAAAAEPSVVSTDILAREPLANTATVKHILIGWKDLADNYGGRIDQRAAKRSKADAEAEVRSLLQQLAAGADFDALMKASSEDPGSAMNARSFTVTPDAGLVIEFRQLSLRLHPDEVGVCQSEFGFHIIKRLS